LNSRVGIGGNGSKRRARAESRKRRHSEFSQAVLAKKAGLHPNYFGRVERGEETVLLVSLRRIAKALGGCVSELVKDI
jgi:transcriptional regulator with XRE-family HTH domain